MTDSDQAVTARPGDPVHDAVERDFTPQRGRRRETDVQVGVIRRVAGISVEEIDRVIAQLQALRDLLRDEGDRVEREIMDFADVSRTRIESLQRFADDLARLRAARPDGAQDQVDHAESPPLADPGT
jgi:hypothetical protein